MRVSSSIFRLPLAFRQSPCRVREADEGVGRGPGVRPTINAGHPIFGKLSGIAQECVRYVVGRYSQWVAPEWKRPATLRR